MFKEIFDQYLAKTENIRKKMELSDDISEALKTQDYRKAELLAVELRGVHK